VVGERRFEHSTGVTGRGDALPCQQCPRWIHALRSQGGRLPSGPRLAARPRRHSELDASSSRWDEANLGCVTEALSAGRGLLAWWRGAGIAGRQFVGLPGNLTA
jgi:hypothetical protein